MKKNIKNTISPFGKKVWIEAVESEGKFKTNDSISLPNKVRVLAIGDKVETVKVGDILILPGYGVMPEVVDGVRYLFTLEDDLLIHGIFKQ